MNTFSEATIRRCSSKWVLLKIAQYSELKRDSNTGVFNNSFFAEQLRWLLLPFFKSN